MLARVVVVLLASVAVLDTAEAQKRVTLNPPARREEVVVARGTVASAHDTARSTVNERSPASSSRTAVAAPFSPFTVRSSVESRYESNINREPVPLGAVGVVTALSVHLQNRPVRPWVEVDYDVALHRYSNSERYDRASQRGRVALSGRLTRWLGVELVSEGSYRGSMEDRDIADQVSLSPRTEFRLGRERRVRLGGAWRWREYDDAPAQNARNRYVSIEYRHRLESGSEWEVEYRLEQNAADSTRYTYDRGTYASTYTTSLGRAGAVEFGVKYRAQTYLHRFVEVEDTDVLRRDARWIPALSWTGRLPYVDLLLGYEWDKRTSNDPSKATTAHVVSFGLARNW